MVQKENKDKTQVSREEYLYHNTEMLLKKYRDVVWSIEVSAMQCQCQSKNVGKRRRNFACF